MYERKNTKGRDISKQICSYIFEFDGIKENKLTFQVDRGPKHVNRRTKVAIFFDVAFDQQSFKSASGLIVRDVRSEILASKTVIHSDIATPFTANAHTRLQAMRLGIYMGLNNLEIMGDSKTVIKKCQSTDFDKLAIGALIRDIQSKKAEFQEIGFHFIPKIENNMPMFLLKRL
ncbi:hypothetical protein PVK06_002876 [Gossypium arboreum]|uniref:RNase H type-1 domain-containing protein n=1 Tax=Gossypium arboreum TaxID=29729 RepID=A0ABR0R4Q4_GOSAR|nr:hypothetical protein PVK06_002876 [Gossypium arboreum]